MLATPPVSKCFMPKVRAARLALNERNRLCAALEAVERQGHDISLPPSKRGPVASDEDVAAAHEAFAAAEAEMHRTYRIAAAEVA